MKKLTSAVIKVIPDPEKFYASELGTIKNLFPHTLEENSHASLNLTGYALYLANIRTVINPQHTYLVGRLPLRPSSHMASLAEYAGPPVTAAFIHAICSPISEWWLADVSVNKAAFRHFISISILTIHTPGHLCHCLYYCWPCCRSCCKSFRCSWGAVK